MTYAAQIKTDSRRHVQDPRETPWITVGTAPTRPAAEALCRPYRADGETVRVVLL